MRGEARARIQIRCSEAEQANWTACAAHVGLDLSEWVRATLAAEAGRVLLHRRLGVQPTKERACAYCAVKLPHVQIAGSWHCTKCGSVSK